MNFLSYDPYFLCPKKSLPFFRLQRFSPMFLLEVLDFQFLVFDPFQVNINVLCPVRANGLFIHTIWMSSCSSNISWKDYFFHMNCALVSCKKKTKQKQVTPPKTTDIDLWIYFLVFYSVFWFICLFLCQYHTVLITVALYKVLKSNTRSPSTFSKLTWLF